MESKSKVISFFIIISAFIAVSNSRSIVKNLPGFHGDLPFTLETGYVGVGEDEQVQVFYYFVESQTNPSDDPLLLYLTGGPGTSGLYSLLYQIGPLGFNFESSSTDNITLELKPYSWTKATNMIFVDLPVGVGFSYAKTWEASRSSDSMLSVHTYDFIRKWLMEHPRFLNNPLYISGISYMGLIIPIVVLETHKGNERGNQPQLNIKGGLIINPLTDKFIDFNSRFEFAHRLALISDDIYESTKETCGGNYVYNDPDNILCSNNLKKVDECIRGINVVNILEPVCGAPDMDPTCGDEATILVDIWANDKDVQKALHIREGTIEKWEWSNSSIRDIFKKNDTIYYSYDIFSSIDYHKQLVAKNCQILIICGDHDMTFPYMGTQKWIKSLNVSMASPWEPWFIRTQVAGYRMTYAQSGYSITFATIKGAGHAVALYKPEEAFIMVDGWLASQTYLSDS